MKRFLIPLLAALALPTAVYSEENDLSNIIKWNRDNGQIVIFNPSSLKGYKEDGYDGERARKRLNYKYIVEEKNGGSKEFRVYLWCKKYKAALEEDGTDMYDSQSGYRWLGLRKKDTYAKREAISIIKDFCPKFKQIAARTELEDSGYTPQDTKRRNNDQFQITTQGNTTPSDEIHNRCKDAKDYVGCVQIMTGNISNKNNANPVSGSSGGGNLRRLQNQQQIQRIKEKQWRLENRIELDKINRERGYGY